MRYAIILLLSLCIAADAAAGRILVRVPAGINLPEERVRERLAGAAAPAGRYDSFEIVVYYYSLGTETFTYSESDSLSESTTGGAIRALIKCRKDRVLKKALFVEAGGTGEEQILDNFRRAIEDAISGL